VRKADNLPPSCAVVMKSGSLNFLEPSGPLQACNGTALPFYILWVRGAGTVFCSWHETQLNVSLISVTFLHTLKYFVVCRNYMTRRVCIYIQRMKQYFGIHCINVFLYI